MRSKCLETKEVKEFHKHKHCKNGINPWCKECAKKNANNYYYNNREYALKKSAIYQKAPENLERIRESKLKYSRKNRENDKNTYLKRVYGITLVEFNQMLINQNNKCLICNKEESLIDKRTGKVVSLSIDHCHKTGKVRGLLCRKCNTIIGYFDDDTLILENAIKYLNKPRN